MLLTSVTEMLFTLVLGSELLASGVAPLLAGIAVVCLTVVAVLVSAIVTRTTVQHVVEEQRALIALRRLLGASSAQERSRVLRSSLAAGIAGTLGGAVVGLGAGIAAQLAVQASGAVAGADVVLLPATALPPVVGIAVAVAAVTRSGTRGVLDVAPIEALGAAAAQPRRPRRPVGALVVLGLAAVVLAGSIALAPWSPFAVLVAVVGGVLLSAGIIGVAPAALVPVLALVGRLLGGSVPARAAVRSAQDARERSSGLVLALMVGIATVVLLATAGSTLREALVAIDRDPVYVAEITRIVDGIVLALGTVVGSSAIVAVLGFATSMLTAVRQRTREIGLLRALGMTGAQVRWMVTAETVAIAVVALVGGLVLGVGLGWVAVWTMLGSAYGVGAIVPSPSPWLLVGTVVAAALVALVAAGPATARARRIAPIDALRVA
ncbi:hypothetical protein GCM10009846_23670 [Agrococcus versicolor]|uniref:ABC3 transporter permease C-terminal domain-containing protein n=1 Tax=Agrococcus versicolor TaxID=501482 RepID=A0ABP5MKD4_9MICO